ncbi:Reverse transcriptase [Phytophthora palmivora]|uniref:Reverse transcriptase n=1 Tax=Phytophthora palmivora TaxID=4796 RepID=A0A2P4YDN6_9STRA|nr:Reverse transcriptase [Phytophthora palmivora]
MVRVPGSSGDSQGFHREPDENATKIRLEPGIEASAEGVSPQTLLSEAGYTHYQSTGGNADDVKEEGSAMDLEEKPHPPPQAPLGAPSDRDANHGPLDEDPSAKADRTSSTTTPPASRVAAKKKKPKTTRKKLKAPDSDAEDRGDVHTWTDDELELAFHRKELASFLTTNHVMTVIRPKVIGDLHGPTWTPTESPNKLDAVKVLMRTLKQAGIVSGAFDANTLFNLDLTLIHKSTIALYQKLVPLVGSVTPEEAPRQTSFRNPEYQTGSSHLRKDEYSRSGVVMELDLLPGEFRGYWKYHAPGKWLKQAKATGKINNEKATLLFDSGAEVSIVDSTFACQEAILGMDFMVPAGIRLDLADGSLCLPDEDCEVAIGGSIEIPIYSRVSDRQKLWITRGERWVPTYVKGLGRRRYLRITNLSDKPLTLFDDAWLGIWLNGDHVPRQPGFVSVGSRRYNERQNLAYEASTDKPEREEHVDQTTRPMVERPTYDPSTKIMARRTEQPEVAAVRVKTPKEEPMQPGPVAEGRLGNEMDAPRMMARGPEHSRSGPNVAQATSNEMPAKTEGSPNLGIPETRAQEADQVCYHEGGDPLAEDFEAHMAVVPEVIATTEKVSPDDIQVGDPDINSPEEIERLRHIIWKKAHLLIGKGNALPPAALGAICDIAVGDATPIAQRCRRVVPQFREKLPALIKGLLSATIITHSTSSEASPIVISVKKNGVDIHLCIVYRLVNSLTKLMVNPMSLISDLLDDLDKVLWFCPLDMASGFWVVSMTERARKISAFITPFGLFKWTRMPFDLMDADAVRLKERAAGEPESEAEPSVVGRRSYIDDILVTAMSWDDLCQKVEKMLDACDRWNLSISVAKSFWGLRKVTYLGHRVSVDGLEANPKDLDFLNYYICFNEDFAVYAAILYELREADFHEIRKDTETGDSDLGTGGDRAPADERDRWAKAQTAFALLKSKIGYTSVLRHFDQDRTPVIVFYANKWAISAALMQEHDGVYWPVTFTSRTLKPNEVNYGIVDKEVLSLLRILDDCYTQLVTRPIKVLSRHSTLAWLLNAPGFDGRLGKWAALLSGWTLEIIKCSKGEEEILGAIAASITPRAEVDKALIAIAPKKQSRQTITMSPPTVESNESLLTLSFDGSARAKRNGGAYSAIVWKLPQWSILEAMSEYDNYLTVNEAESRGLLLCFELLETQDRGRIVICGDSNLVIRQMRGEIDCKAPGLQLLRRKAMDRLRSWPDHEFLHVKREWNQSADKLASAALQRLEGEIVTSEKDREDLATLNRLSELLKPKPSDDVARIEAVTRSLDSQARSPRVLEDAIVQRKRSERIREAQNEEKWIADVKFYLKGDLGNLTADDQRHVLRSRMIMRWTTAICSSSAQTIKDGEDRGRIMRLVVPENLQQDFLHHYHSRLEGGHQGIGRAYLRIRSHFQVCIEVSSVMWESVPTVISMDHIPSLPRSFKGNTELLIWADLLSGYVIVKPAKLSGMIANPG